jgi:hypothetical protein
MLRLATSGTTRIKAIALQVIPADAAHIADNLEAAIRYAVQHGVRVINMSLSITGEACVARIKKLIRDNPDILFVKSAGNAFALVGAPKREPTVAVARTRPGGCSGQFSPIGPPPTALDDVTLGTPGPFDLAAAQIPNLAIVAAGTAQATRATFSSYSSTAVAFAANGEGGTSQAAANTSNAAEKIRIICPSLTAEQVQQVIAATVDTSPKSDWHKWVREGVINRARAMRLAGLVELVRRGTPAEQAADRLSLRGAERQWLLGSLAPFFAR